MMESIEHISVSSPEADRVLKYILTAQPDRFRDSDAELIAKAWRVANDAHEGQTRKSGAPYIEHPVEVARILSELRFDSHTIAAGLLHDVLEDTETTAEDLAKIFPEPVVHLVEGVTKISSLNFHSSREVQVANLRKMMLSMIRDIRVIIVKLSDRLHNMRTLEFLPPKKQVAISRDTIDIYAPLADRLGMVRLKSEIEDLSMRYLHPKEFKHIQSYLNQNKNKRDQQIYKTVEILKHQLKEAGIKATVQGRTKHFYSIHNKMKRQRVSLDEIYDIVALRIICETKQNCYEAMGVVHELWLAIPQRFKDNISMPRPNGYQSIHTTVVGLKGHFTEIQIRTWEMHRIAEEGIAAHWKYKEGFKNQEENLNEQLVWLRSLVGWLTEIEDPNEFMDSLKEGVASESIFCFTPKGDVIETPCGSCPVDFAFHIHTQVGYHCTGARVNGRMVPLKQVLQNSDVVEIITSKKGHPSPGWLDFVKSGKARNKIRHWMKSQNYEENVQHGRDALLRAYRDRTGAAISWNDLYKNLQLILRSLRMPSVDDLLMEIGFGSVLPQNIVYKLVPRKKKIKKRTRKKKSSSGVIVSDIPDTMVRFANCCSPIPGDSIIGYITIGRGVSIHKKSCKSFAALVASRGEDSRVIGVQWDDEHLLQLEAALRVTAFDRAGLLRDVSGCFEDAGLFIRESASASGKGGTATLRFKIDIQNKAQIEKIVPAIQNIFGVIKVDQIQARQISDE